MKQEKAYKIKLVKILEILRQDSDEDNYIESTEILSKLANMGIECDRRTLYGDIDVLNDFGYYENLAKANDCNIISSECWTGITLGWGANPCLAMCLLADKDIYVTCEWDIHMTITNVLLLSASRGKEKPIQGEFTCRHPENDNAELLWHCGPFPLKYKAKGEKPYLYNTKPSFRLEDGEYTIARFQAEKGKYYLFGEKFHTCEGPKTFGTYLWAEFKDLPALERKLVEGPYIHHMTEIPGDYTEYLKEFAKYVDEVQFDNAEL